MPGYKEVLKDIAIPKTKLEQMYTLITTAIAFAIIIFIITIWNQVPSTIPTHFNALGQPDDSGSKWLVLIFPVIAFCVISITNLFKKHPEWGNYPARINENNAAEFYLENRKLLTMINCGIVLTFLLAALEMVLVGGGWIESSSIWVFLLVIMILVVAPMIVTMIKIRKIK